MSGGEEGFDKLSPNGSTKRWWQSRTLWFNALCLAAAAAEANLGVLEKVLPGGFYAWLAFVVPIGNALMRAVSATALTFKSGGGS